MVSWKVDYLNWLSINQIFRELIWHPFNAIIENFFKCFFTPKNKNIKDKYDNNRIPSFIEGIIDFIHYFQYF